MPARNPRDDQLAGLMQEWAQWYSTLGKAGYSDSTTLWRAVYSSGGSGFGSQVPHGVDGLRLHGALKRLVEAMDSLLEDDDARGPVAAVQGFYLAGLAAVKEVTGYSQAKVYNVLQIGEALIRREMKLR
jgi:hypothetical protein